MMGKPPKLTAAQASHLRVRYELWQLNKPKILQKEYGICAQTMRHYVLHHGKTRP